MLPLSEPGIILFFDFHMGDVDLFLKLDSQGILDVLLVLLQLNVIFKENGVVVNDLGIFYVVALDLIT